MKIPKPSEVGVYIYSETSSPNDVLLEKFGFNTEDEVFDYIKEHIKVNGCFIVYTYDKVCGTDTLKPLIAGDKDDLT